MQVPKYLLKQLGPIGTTLNTNLDFFWPDQETFKKLPEDVHVAKITFKRHPNCINYVHFVLSDGTSSPVIETTIGNKEDEKTLTFESDA